VRIGDRDLPRDQARDVAADYAIRHHDTVLWYDLAGDESPLPDPARAAEPVNTVTLADIGRLVIINAGLRPDHVPALLTAASEQIAAVPPDARLQECAPGSSLYLAATQLYDQFRHSS
jgi:hypothetical protein